MSQVGGGGEEGGRVEREERREVDLRRVSNNICRGGGHRGGFAQKDSLRK